MSTTDQPTAIIRKAIDQLNGSERGHSALVALAKACDSLTGLDALNQQAVITLVTTLYDWPQSGREAIKQAAAIAHG
ncbi:MAG: hypothetical protein LBK99_12675 [Opitutaceae bacterium]|jgi:hypothetical protein|nr:hypothetical protein [Opitutaceae bacterium]